MDYYAISNAGGLAKPVREPKPKKGLKKRTPLKARYNSIPLEIKIAVFQEKGNRCFWGFCEHCGGQAIVTVNDDFHHHPKRSHRGKNIVDHLFPCLRLCHSYYEEHPLEEKEMFKRMEAAGIPVIWEAQTKGLGAA
jgi:hypothetical protein